VNGNGCGEGDYGSFADPVTISFEPGIPGIARRDILHIAKKSGGRQNAIAIAFVIANGMG